MKEQLIEELLDLTLPELNKEEQAEMNQLDQEMKILGTGTILVLIKLARRKRATAILRELGLS